MKDDFLEQLISRLDKLEPQIVENCLRRLVQERGFMKTISSTVREGIIVIDGERRISYVNPAAIEFLGLPENVHNEKIDRFIKQIDWSEILSEDPTRWRCHSTRELEVIYPIHRYLNFYIVPHTENIEAIDYHSYHAIIILNDITERREKIDATIEDQKSQVISMLAATVAHEIGNPLNGINIHLQLLRRQFKQLTDVNQEAVGKMDKSMTVVEEELERLDSMINNFLKAIRPTKLNLEAGSINNILSEALNFMKHEIENRHILVEVQQGSDEIWALVDRNQLKQAFYNIIKNASQAMADGGILTIACERKEDNVEIDFIDSGCGISAAQISRILDPYYTTKPDGTGLGLLVVERIVREHNGELIIESEEGKGTLFKIRLPIHNSTTSMRRLDQHNEVE